MEYVGECDEYRDSVLEPTPKSKSGISIRHTAGLVKSAACWTTQTCVRRDDVGAPTMRKIEDSRN